SGSIDAGSAPRGLRRDDFSRCRVRLFYARVVVDGDAQARPAREWEDWEMFKARGVFLLTVLLALATRNQAPAVVVWGPEHDDRAKALAKDLKEDVLKLRSTPAPMRSTDTTLTVWGHSSQSKFCGMSAKEFTQLLLEWKKKNPQLKTIELITCD